MTRLFEKKNGWFALLFFAVLVFVVYGRAIYGDFLIGWDDDAQILNNPDVQKLEWESTKKLFSTYYVGSYQPLASLSFAVEYDLFGANALINHVTNLFLFLHNIILLFYILHQWFPTKVRLIWFVTLVFALQPYQVEVVSWISTRSTLLSYAFLFWAIYSYNKMCYKNRRKYRLNRFVSVFVLFLLACFSKSSAILLTPFLFAIEYLYDVRLDLRKIVEKTPFLLVSLIFGLTSIDSRQIDLTLDDFYNYYSWYEHVLLKGKTLFFYTFEWLYTDTLHILRPFPRPNTTELTFRLPFDYYWQTLATFSFLSFLGIWWFRAKSSTVKKRIGFGLALFFIFIGLNLNVVAVGTSMLGERYNYFPSVGLAIAGYCCLFETDYLKRFRTVSLILVLGLFVRFALVSKSQVDNWSSSEALFLNDVKHSKNGYSFHQLGKIKTEEADYDMALNFFNEAIYSDVAKLDYYLSRADVESKIGGYELALKDYKFVLKNSHLRNTSRGSRNEVYRSKAYLGLGKIYESINRDLALQAYDSAITLGSAMAYDKKEKLLSNPLEANKKENTILDNARLALKRQDYKELKMYAQLLQENAEGLAVGLKFLIHAQVGLKEYDNALKTSFSLLKIVPNEEQQEILNFINEITTAIAKVENGT